MFRAIVEGGFSATHQVRLRGGALEPIHGHDWRVRLHLATSELNEQDMVVDFLHAQDILRSVLDRLDHTDLASCSGLTGRNPTAERVAQYVYEQVEAGGLPMIAAVEVTEAPGCVAVYAPGAAAAGDSAPIDPRDGHL